MISQKTLTGLALALIVLAALSWFTSQRRYSPVEGGGFQDLMTEAIDTGSVQTVRAWLGSSPESAVELQRSGDDWTVATSWGWPAKAELVDKLLTDLGALRGERRSSSGDVLADYQIDEDGGLHVVGSGDGGADLFHLISGKTADRGGSFIRRQDSNDVFITSTSLRSSFGVWGDEPSAPDAKRWMELKVHQAERLDVDRITLSDGDQEILLEKVFAAPDSAGTVSRADWTWKSDGSGEFDKGKVDGLLGTLCSLYASEAVDPGDPDDVYGLTDSRRTVSISFADGHSTTISFGSNVEEGNTTYLHVSEGMPALIYSSTVDRIFQSRADLKPTET